MWHPADPRPSSAKAVRGSPHRWKSCPTCVPATYVRVRGPRGKHPLSRVHGLGHAVVLRAPVARQASGRSQCRHDAHRVLPARRGPRLRDHWTTLRGVEAMDYSYALMDLTVYGRQEPWEDSPSGWPQDWQSTAPTHGSTDAPSPSGARTARSGGAQRAPRIKCPGRAPVSTPSRRVTTPVTIVAV